MKKLTLLFMTCLCLSFAKGQVFQKDTFAHNGTSNRIKFVYLSDGYTGAELSNYINDASAINNQLFQISPFKEYKSYFSVYAVRVPSVASGAKHANTASDCPAGGAQPTTNPLNYFGSKFDAGGIHRLVVADSSAKIQSVLASNFPGYHLSFIVVNSEFYGGSGGLWPTATRNISSKEIAIHELGHSFANLADEYWAGTQYAAERANMTRESSPTLVKWKNWVGTNNVGVFPYAVDPTWYRPVTGSRCKMEVLGVPFCSVCKEAITERIHQLVTPLDSYFPAATNIAASGGVQGFKLNVLPPNPNTLKIIWKLNGTTIATNVDTISVTAAQIATGNHIISATVVDTTELTRSDTHVSAHLYSVQWNINAVTRVIDPVLYAAKIKAFPNPFTENLFVSYELNKLADVRIELYNIQGQLLDKIEKRKQSPGKYNLNLINSKTRLTSGTYFMRFFLNNNDLTQETIKIH